MTTNALEPVEALRQLDALFRRADNAEHYSLDDMIRDVNSMRAIINRGLSYAPPKDAA